jgi:RNA polymerase sigma-70 factor (ECF subfamily)
VQDEPTFTRWVERYKDGVFRIAYEYLRNRADAEDVVQTTFIKLYQSSVPFADEAHVRRWLMRVAVNECTSLWRAFKRRPEDIDDYLDELVAADEDGTGDREVLQKVLRLPHRYGGPLYLHYYEGYTYGEIADMLQVSESTVRTRLARGRRKLKSVLQEEDAL